MVKESKGLANQRMAATKSCLLPLHGGSFTLVSVMKKKRFKQIWLKSRKYLRHSETSFCRGVKSKGTWPCSSQKKREECIGMLNNLTRKKLIFGTWDQVSGVDRGWKDKPVLLGWEGQVSERVLMVEEWGCTGCVHENSMGYHRSRSVVVGGSKVPGEFTGFQNFTSEPEWEIWGYQILCFASYPTNCIQ